MNGDGLLTWMTNGGEVRDSHFEDVHSSVTAIRGSGITVHHNTFRNTRGPHGNYVQFDKVTGAGNRINHNTGENPVGGGDPEEGISLYMTHGTSGSPVEVILNRLRG